MRRLILFLPMLLSASPALAQTTINARGVTVDGAGRLDQVIAGKAPIDSAVLTGAPTAPTPALTSSLNSTRVATVQMVRQLVGGRDLRTFSAYSASDVGPALDACIQALNAPTGGGGVCTGPEGPMQLLTAPSTAITCMDCGFDFRRSTFNVTGAAANAEVLFQIGSPTSTTGRFTLRGKFRVNFVTPPPAGSYIFDVVNTAQVELAGVEANNAAGLARFGAAASNATQTVLRGWRVTLGAGAPPTDQFLMQGGGNTTFDDVNMTGNLACADGEHGFWAIRPLPGRSTDTVRLINSGAQCFTRGFDDDGVSTGPVDGKSYGLIIDTTKGANAVYNVFAGPNTFLDHTTTCGVLIKTAAGDTGKIRNIFLNNLRVTADAGSNYCLYNDGGVLARNIQIRDGRAAIAGTGPHIDIRGSGWSGSIRGVHFADSNPSTAKPVSVRLASDGWIIGGNDWAAAIAGASGVGTAIEITNPDITIAKVNDNFAPQAAQLLSVPSTWTTPVAPNRQIAP